MANYRDEAPQIIKDFLRYQKKNKDHTDKTIDEYYLDLRIFFRFMKMDRGAVTAGILFNEISISELSLAFISEIKKTDINNYIDYLRSDRIVNEGQKNESLGIKAISTQRKIACLKSFFGYLCENQELLSKNPTIGVITPLRRRTLPKYLTEEECLRLLKSIEGENEIRDFCIILIFVNCGLRVSEVTGIDIADLRADGDEAFLNIRGKGEKERQVFLSDGCMEAIHQYLIERSLKPNIKDKDALFLSKRNTRISVDAIQYMVKARMKQAGLSPMSPHKLRHTAATLMLKNGVDIRTLQEVLGHDSLSSTQIYTHVENDLLRGASRANPMSKIRKQT